jgi:hypothetical protein
VIFAPGALGVLSTVKCDYCGKSKISTEVYQFATRGARQVTRCWNCQAHHLEALQRIASGTVPRECVLCHVSLRSEDGNPRGKVFCHCVDNVHLAFTCATCSKAYMKLRKDMFGHTEEGAKLDE